MIKTSSHFHLLLAITGASGARYAARFMEKVKSLPSVRLSIVVSTNGKEVWNREMQMPLPESEGWRYYDPLDFSAPFASGSCCADSMLILPCSMGSVARIAHGISDSLITRAADVQLKERRPLIIVPRESPFNLIHLRNLTQLCESGAIIAPTSPSFYHQPTSIETLVEPFVDRLLFLCGATPHYIGYSYQG
ncbi:MAG: UbiX family flavin prenyltransferase [Prevotellaceae bacterium]|jgi:4-hydroxy-3-polyprenylbenzoate decarboxylase|nr:UbiX family flavin prenyltransferase [Prevotellaceae bacterium]